MSTERIQSVADEEGYELAHGQESYGRNAFGLLVFVKMSNRKLGDKDSPHLFKAVDQLRNGFNTVSAELDPEGPSKRAHERAVIEAIYRDAGVEAIYMEELPNGYCKEPCCLNRPWFRVTSKIGHVVIGWRKHVISIDWKDSTIKASGEDLFPAEMVTNWSTGIHAYGADAAAKYIRRLHEQ